MSHCLPQVAALRRQLGAEQALRRRQLPLWTPPLEVPFPALQPAVFPPPFADLPPPPLELFDLEEELAGPLVGGCGGAPPSWEV
jgi:intraflagellar transport protein 52